VTLEGEMVLLRPLELDDENALQKVADDSRLWVYGLQDLSKSGELIKYMMTAIADRQKWYNSCVGYN
jgi:hypothetical protein